MNEKTEYGLLSAYNSCKTRPRTPIHSAEWWMAQIRYSPSCRLTNEPTIIPKAYSAVNMYKDAVEDRCVVFPNWQRVKLIMTASVVTGWLTSNPMTVHANEPNRGMNYPSSFPHCGQWTSASLVKTVSGSMRRFEGSLAVHYQLTVRC